ncbi:kinetochore protein ndc80 [Anaeramoeba flamelloides]|uniref:Kinetochore protein NDC80 n=1 Tax=Anaeramoeba flamelloides TaxID=1746091 RepID=A0ABQ8XBT9_9EUKA|nr:kinetochore protein ndc80 [Anaeramoeba flamelloides]
MSLKKRKNNFSSISNRKPTPFSKTRSKKFLKTKKQKQKQQKTSNPKQLKQSNQPTPINLNNTREKRPINQKITPRPKQELKRRRQLSNSKKQDESQKENIYPTSNSIKNTSKDKKDFLNKNKNKNKTTTTTTNQVRENSKPKKKLNTKTNLNTKNTQINKTNTNTNPNPTKNPKQTANKTSNLNKNKNTNPNKTTNTNPNQFKQTQTKTNTNKSKHKSRSSLIRKTHQQTNKRRDPRPLHDQKYHLKVKKQIIRYLDENGLEKSKSSKMLTKPSKNSFFDIAQFLIKKLDPNFVFTEKPEILIIGMFKKLRYPVPITRTSLYSITSPQTWQNLMGAILWLTELLMYLDQSKNREKEILQMALLQKSINQTKEFQIKNEIEVDPEKTIDELTIIGEDGSGERAFFEYLSASYQCFLTGDDDQFEKLEQEVANCFNENNKIIQNGIETIQAENQKLIEQINEQNTTDSDNCNFNDNKAKLENELNGLMDQIQELEIKNSKSEMEITKLKEDEKLFIKEYKTCEQETEKIQRENENNNQKKLKNYNIKQDQLNKEIQQLRNKKKTIQKNNKKTEEQINRRTKQSDSHFNEYQKINNQLKLNLELNLKVLNKSTNNYLDIITKLDNIQNDFEQQEKLCFENKKIAEKEKNNLQNLISELKKNNKALKVKLQRKNQILIKEEKKLLKIKKNNKNKNIANHENLKNNQPNNFMNNSSDLSIIEKLEQVLEKYQKKYSIIKEKNNQEIQETNQKLISLLDMLMNFNEHIQNKLKKLVFKADESWELLQK